MVGRRTYIFDEDHLEKIANIRVIVDHITDFVDQMNHALRHPVPRSTLPTNDRNTRSELLPLFRAHLLNVQVAVDDTEDVELLTLVFMHTLDLDVEEGSRVDADACGVLDIFGESDFVSVLDLSPFLTEFLVVHELLKLADEGEVFQEVIATKLGGNQFRQTRIGLMEPASWSDAVRDITEAVCTVDLDEISEDCGLDQFGMQLGDAVDFVRADDCEICHSYLEQTLVRATLNDF